MSIRDLMNYYARKWYIVVSLTVVGLLCGLIYNYFIQVPLFRSDAKLILISSESTGTINDQTRINNYIELIKSRRVLDPVIANQHEKVSYEDVSHSLIVTNERDTQVINVAVASPDAKRSKAIANDITSSFINAASKLYGSNDVKVVDAAVVAKDPYNVNKPLQLLVATVGSFAAVVSILFFVYDIQASANADKKVDSVAVTKTTALKRKNVKTKSQRPVSLKKSSNTVTLTKSVKPSKKRKNALSLGSAKKI